MKVIKTSNLDKSRVVECPKGGFISNRILLESDNMGYTMTKTVIPPKGAQFWHYKNHLESCYCISGKGILTSLDTNESFVITPDVIYSLDNHDNHTFEAITDVILISVFNPPVKGNEVHKEDGSYEL